jgi:hypothetical protein
VSAVEIVGFPRYRRDVAALPLQERAKFDSLARRIVSAYGTAQQINAIGIVGHADLDTPRRPAVEMKMSEDRALRARQALVDAIYKHAAGTRWAALCPPLPARINWHLSALGAKELRVATPRTETDRRRNRRVEVRLLREHATAQPVRLAFAEGQTAKLDLGKRFTALLRSQMDAFCRRLGKEGPAAYWCFSRVQEVVAKLRRTAPAGAGERCAKIKTAASPGMLIASTANENRCVTVDKGGVKDETYFVLRYHPKALAAAIAKLKQALDCGCIVKVGVMSGLCADNLDRSCQVEPRWRECPEHYVLAIAHDGNTFLFWDPSSDSAFGCEGRLREFGLFFYDDTNDRFCTAPTAAPAGVDPLAVTPSGHHRDLTPRQKRFQVLSVWAADPYQSPSDECGQS